MTEMTSLNQLATRLRLNAASMEHGEAEADIRAAADILDSLVNAEARDGVVLHLSKEGYKGMQEALSEHDRLCEMLSESRKSVGNAAAMREALLEVKRLFDGRIMFQPAILKAHKAVDAALSATARNCDVGTADEQTKRYDKFCDIHDCRSDCPLFKADSCELSWAQMPYEEQEGGAK